MTDQETTQIIQELVNKAAENRAQPFRTILYWSEFKYYRWQARSTKVVIKVLRLSAIKVFKEYCKDVIAGISDITKLMAHLQLLDIVDFYENELVTLKAMLDDYDQYLGNFGNFVRALCGERRES